jgi:kynureninase
MTDDAFWSSALSEAEAADAADPLAGFRGRFRLPPGVIYLDGNSLGPAPEASLAALGHAAEREWADDLIVSWNKAGWYELPVRCGDLLAPLIGADPGEVVACDTTTLNVYKALHAGLSLRPDRRVIVAEAGSFPTDLYAAEGVRATRPDVTLRLEGVDGPELEGLIDDDVAVVLVNQVDYRTGRRRNVAGVTAAAHAAGAVVVWDLCHSAGVMEVGLNAAGADLAVGCTYKYLNGGPGSPAFVFCARRHQAAVRHPLSGWWGHARPFGFEVGFEPVADIRRFLCGTQPILSFRGLFEGLKLAGEADPALVRAKSVALTSRFLALAEAAGAAHGVGVLSPRDPDARGSQVALTHPEGYAVVQALIARGVVGDFRMPDIMRFGFAPLYLRHADVVRAARTLEQVLAGRVWDCARYRERAAVT